MKVALDRTLSKVDPFIPPLESGGFLGRFCKPKWRAMINHWYARFEPIASNEFETWETITNE